MSFSNLSLSSSSLYLFLIVTSVTPATSATSLCVLFSPCIRAETYKAAAAMPVGPLPEVNSAFWAFSRISIDFDWLSGLNFSAEANLAI